MPINHSKIQNLVLALRSYRVYHRFVGLALAIIVIMSSITGIFLAWKKDVSWIQPPTQKTKTTELEGWLSIKELYKLGEAGLIAAYPDVTTSVDRIDLRPSKGVAKVLFEDGYWEVQLDGHTGAVLSVARRHSDWIEQLHDGSLISQPFKLVSMNALGVGLLFMVLSGFWLWFGPRKIRKLKEQK